jgi:hypothetical protein
MESVAQQSHRLPGRSVSAIHREAENLGLGSKVTIGDDVAGSIKAILSGDKSMSLHEIYSASPFGVARVRAAVKGLVAEGKMHISGHRGEYHTILYKFGGGENAVRPVALTPEERRLRFEERRREAGLGPETEEEEAARLDEKHRVTRCSWWPKADQIVAGAVRNMVEAGSGSL